MFRPLACYIGLRYTRAKRRNHFISFITLTSMVGIALGVMVLITVLSVMNGFDSLIKTRIFAMAPQLTVTGLSGDLKSWQGLAERLARFAPVRGVAPYVSAQGMLTQSGRVHPVLMTGILPQREATVSALPNKLTQGTLESLVPGRFGVILGESLAQMLGLSVGDKVTLVTTRATITPVGVWPRFRQLTLVGTFRVGQGLSFDNNLAFIHLRDAQRLMQMGQAVSGLRLQLQDLYAAPRLKREWAQVVQGDYQWRDWTQDYGEFFYALRLEKTMMFIILLLIIAVAAFNLVSSLVMVVTDKQADIAILRTLGALPRTIMAIFMVQGMVIGVLGTLLGVLGGVALAKNVTQLVAFLEQLLGFKLLGASVYYVNYLPSQLLWRDVTLVGGVAMIMAFVATLYPAWRATRIQPAEVLRHE